MTAYPLRLLLIDDDEDDILLTRDLIAEQGEDGWTVESVMTAAEGRAAMARHGYDVYLIDYRLGAESGIELVQDVRAAGSLAPLIVLTGQGDEEIGIAAIQAGADDYLVKGHLTAAELERSARYAYERKRAEQERFQLLRERAARAEAEAAVAARDQFIAIAAHELKTPLTTIYGNMQLLRRSLVRAGSLSARDQRLLEVAVDQLSRLTSLLNSMLDVSRVSSGQISLNRHALEICAFTRRVVDEVQAGLEHHTIVTSIPLAPILVLADDLRLEQVLQNLLNNAVKYSPGGGRITVTLEQQGTDVCISLSDEGLGIPAANLPYLFQRFYRAETADTRHIVGMGVGLAIAHEIVALHDGRIEVESQEGVGSTFRVYLPILVQPASS